MDLLNIMVHLDSLAEAARGAPKTKAAIIAAARIAEQEFVEVRDREAERRSVGHQRPGGPGAHGWGRPAVLKLHPEAVCKAVGLGHDITLWPDGPRYYFNTSAPRAWCLTAKLLGLKPEV
jgi:hypothetical protein